MNELLDLEGNKLERGQFYIIPGRTTQEMVIAIYSHETVMSFIFKGVSKYSGKFLYPNLDLGGVNLYTYDRIIPKWGVSNSILAIKASQEVLNRYGLV